MWLRSVAGSVLTERLRTADKGGLLTGPAEKPDDFKLK
jgi:hypothetical protein